MVGEVADPARVLAHAEVGRQVRRADDRLGLEEDRGGRDAGDRAERAGEVVHLGLVLAVGAEALPDEGDRVEAEHLHAQVGQRQDDVGELAEDGGVRPVEVPLVVVERRPDPAGQLVVPGEAARCEVGEHLRQRRLVGVGHLAVGVHVEEGPPVRVARPRRDGPLVLARDVVEHEVEAEADALAAQRGREVAQVVDRAEVGPHGAVVHDRVATVVGRRSRRQERHQVQVADTQPTQVRRALAHPAQRAGETVRVRGVPHHRGPLEPVRLAQPPLVERAQLGRPRRVRRPRDLDQGPGDLGRGGGAVDPRHGVAQVGLQGREPLLEARVERSGGWAESGG